MDNPPIPAIDVYFDGGCGACRRSVKWLQRWDRRHQMGLVDVDAPTFDPATVGKTREQMLARIHGRLSDGTWVAGVDVFRRVCTVWGLGPLVAVTRLPLISQLLDWGYALFARHRRRSGHCGADACSVAPIAQRSSLSIRDSY
jgi:predicted DCC family thiol-disulfide oxidoreductase YuxK